MQLQLDLVQEVLSKSDEVRSYLPPSSSLSYFFVSEVFHHPIQYFITFAHLDSEARDPLISVLSVQ